MSTQKISLKRLKYSAKANFEHNSAAAASPEFYRSRAFSKDGFIEDQNALNLACGAHSAAYCGCGFIAAYNLLSTDWCSAARSVRARCLCCAFYAEIFLSQSFISRRDAFCKARPAAA